MSTPYNDPGIPDPYRQQQNPGQTPYVGQPFGQQPYPPQPYGSLPQPGTGAFGPFDVGQSLTYAFKAFAATWTTWIIPQLIYFAAFFFGYLLFVVPMALSAASGEAAAEELPISAGGGILMSLLGLVLFAVAVVFQLNLYRCAVRVVRGEPVSLSDFFRLRGLGIPFAVMLSVGLLTLLGLVALIVGTLVVAFVLQFALVASVAARDPGVGSALSASWQVVKNNVGHSILLYLCIYLGSVVGGLTIIGVFVAVPVIALAQAHAFLTSARAPIIPRV